MKLRTKIGLYLCFTFLALMLGVSVLSSRLLMQSYLRLEREDTEEDLGRVCDAIKQSLVSLEEKTSDWAYWDDTYKFMQDHNSGYIKSNLMATGMQVIKTEGVMYLSPDRRLFHYFGIKRLPELPAPDEKEIFSALHLETIKDGEEKSGIVLTSQGLPVQISLRTILNSEKKGPSRGWLVFLRYLDASKIKALASSSHLEFTVVSANSPHLTLWDRQVLSQSAHAPLIPAQPTQSKTLLGYTQLRGMRGEPVLLIRLKEKRTIFAQGLTTIAYVTRMLTLGVLLFGVVVFLLLETLVLSRISQLTGQVERLSIGNNSLTRVRLSGYDELAQLARRVNEMLMKLERATQDLTHQNEQLIFQMFRDGLTKLPNRAGLKERFLKLETEDPASPSLTALLFLNLDNFKTINDSLGHEAGDQLLVQVGERLKAGLQPGETAARLGGDEFVLFMETVQGEAEAITKAEAVFAKMSQTFQIEGAEFFMHVSIGIALEKRPVSFELLLRNADTAMYHAKANGKSRFSLFETRMNDRVTERIDIEVGLRQALEKEEFSVHYQPLVDLKTGRLVGAEALMRWKRDGEMISPGRFISIAEETGLILPMGYWVMETACRQAKLWRDLLEFSAAPFQFTMNVNLSGKQLCQPDVVERIFGILEQTSLPPEALKVEITESIMMTDVDTAARKLRQLKARGVKLAVDDFGTGYSSMATLSAFPLDTVKIDRAFISRLNEQSEAGAIIQAILSLSEALKMDVTGEGVETASQMSTLREMGCGVGQGYYFAKPLEAGVFETRLTDQFILPETEGLPKAA